MKKGCILHMSVIANTKKFFIENISPAGIYQLLVDFLGLFIIYQALSQAVQGWDMGMLWVFFFCLLSSTVTEMKPINMPNNDLLTISFAVHISVMILFGLPMAVLSCTIANIITDILGRRGWQKVLFNISQYAVTIYCSWFVYQLVRTNTGPVDFKSDFWAMLLSCLVYVIVNFILVTTIISLSQGINWFRQLTNDIRLEVIHFAALVPVSLLIVILYTYEPLSIIILVLPLAMAHFSFDNYITLRTETRKTIEALADIIDQRDAYTAQHSSRVAKYCEAIANKLILSPGDYETLVTAAKVHDLGKISIPDAILLKEGPLTPEERQVINTHALCGYEVLNNLRFYKAGARIVSCHHERYDGKGYPEGLKGEEIPLGARIMAVADSYDAMTSDRPYRKALDMEIAIQELIKHSGTQFDPEIVRVFIETLRENT